MTGRPCLFCLIIPTSNVNGICDVCWGKLRSDSRITRDKRNRDYCAIRSEKQRLGAMQDIVNRANTIP